MSGGHRPAFDGSKARAGSARARVRARCQGRSSEKPAQSGMTAVTQHGKDILHPQRARARAPRRDRGVPDQPRPLIRCPGTSQPMLALLSAHAPARREGLGVRIQVGRRPRHRVSHERPAGCIESRNLLDITRRYPELDGAARRARQAQRDPRRRDRRARRPRPPQLSAPAAAHARERRRADRAARAARCRSSTCSSTCSTSTASR